MSKKHTQNRDKKRRRRIDEPPSRILSRGGDDEDFRRRIVAPHDEVGEFLLAGRLALPVRAHPGSDGKIVWFRTIQGSRK